jgi:hypothetical protein
MRQLTSQELSEPNSSIIIPARIWDTLPHEVTGIMYGYIGRLGRIGNTPAYRFDDVPGYKVREFEAACKALTE